MKKNKIVLPASPHSPCQIPSHPGFLPSKHLPGPEILVLALCYHQAIVRLFLYSCNIPVNQDGHVPRAKELNRNQSLFPTSWDSHVGVWAALCWLVSGLVYRDAGTGQEPPSSGSSTSTALCPRVNLCPAQSVMKPWPLPSEQAPEEPQEARQPELAVDTHSFPSGSLSATGLTCHVGHLITVIAQVAPRLSHMLLTTA